MPGRLRTTDKVRAAHPQKPVEENFWAARHGIYRKQLP